MAMSSICSSQCKGNLAKLKTLMNEEVTDYSVTKLMNSFKKFKKLSYSKEFTN